MRAHSKRTAALLRRCNQAGTGGTTDRESHRVEDWKLRVNAVSRPDLCTIALEKAIRSITMHSPKNIVAAADIYIHFMSL